MGRLVGASVRYEGKMMNTTIGASRRASADGYSTMAQKILVRSSELARTHGCDMARTTGHVLVAMLETSSREYSFTRSLAQLELQVFDVEAWVEDYLASHEHPRDFDAMLDEAIRLAHINGPGPSITVSHLCKAVFTCQSPMMDDFIAHIGRERRDFPYALEFHETSNLHRTAVVR